MTSLVHCSGIAPLSKWYFGTGTELHWVVCEFLIDRLLIAEKCFLMLQFRWNCLLINRMPDVCLFILRSFNRLRKNWIWCKRPLSHRYEIDWRLIWVLIDRFREAFSNGVEEHELFGEIGHHSKFYLNLQYAKSVLHPTRVHWLILLELSGTCICDIGYVGEDDEATGSGSSFWYWPLSMFLAS